jgi:hypothetical protein
MDIFFYFHRDDIKPDEQPLITSSYMGGPVGGWVSHYAQALMDNTIKEEDKVWIMDFAYFKGKILQETFGMSESISTTKAAKK